MERDPRSLVLNGYGGYRVPKFEYLEKTEVAYSCAVTVKNEIYVYGGWDYMDQISKVDGCSLRRVGSLPFPLHYGACAYGGDEQVYLCFDVENETMKTCVRSGDPEKNFNQINDSNYDHWFIRIASSEGELRISSKTLEYVQT